MCMAASVQSGKYLITNILNTGLIETPCITSSLSCIDMCPQVESRQAYGGCRPPLTVDTDQRAWRQAGAVRKSCEDNTDDSQFVHVLSRCLVFGGG